MTSLADRCPACGPENNSPPVLPYRSRESRGMITARYKCPDCALRWFTCWDMASLAGAA